MLKINNLHVSFESNLVIDDANIEFPEASIIGIIGKNGSGKSTLLKAIEGLVPYSGSIEFNGNNIDKLSIKEKAKLISYLPQNRIVPQISARLMIEHGRFPYRSFSKTLSKDDKEIIDRAINKTGVSKLLNKKLNEMSGGELQKVYITSTIVQQTDVILLDEPTNHLDLESQIEILDLLKEFKKDKRTVIIVLHDLLQAFTYCDKIVLLDEHKVVLQDTPEKLYKNKDIKRIFKYKLIKDEDSKTLYKYKLSK